LLTLAPGTHGQEATPLPAETTLKVAVDVVNVYAVVRDKRGRLIPDLKAEDFELREDNALQQIRYFTRETDVPLTLGILIDTSVSQERVLGIEKEEAKRFLRQVLRPRDLACVLHFDLEVELLQDFTGDQRLLARAIDETVINAGGQGPVPPTVPTSGVGGTHLYDAVYLTANELMKNEVGRKVIILLSDGHDQGSLVSLDQALAAAQKADVIIYSIAVIDRDFYRFRWESFGGDSVLSKFSVETGGRVIQVKRAEHTAAAFQAVADELRTQYLLGYVSANTKRDGSFRKIRLRVPKGEYRVQARHGYYAPQS